MPEPLKAGDIDVKIGAAWIPKELYQQFMYELFQTPRENREDVKKAFCVKPKNILRLITLNIQILGISRIKKLIVRLFVPVTTVHEKWVLMRLWSILEVFRDKRYPLM